MIILSDTKSTFELDLLAWDGDAYVSVNVDSRGFIGSNDLHVHADEFREFCTNLVSLQKQLKGNATLRSVLSGELYIEIKPFGSRGHISVTGKIGNEVRTDQSHNWHSIEFGFEIDPQQLDQIMKISWIREHSK